MTRQKRYPLLLDIEYPPEREVLRAIESVPEGERARFMRVLILLGHADIQQSAAVHAPRSEGRAHDGAEKG